MQASPAANSVAVRTLTIAPPSPSASAQYLKRPHWPHRASQRPDRAPGQSHRERRSPGHRSSRGERREHRLQEGSLRTGGRRRRSRSEAGNGGPAKAGRSQSQRRCRTPDLGHVDSRVDDLQRRRQIAPVATNPKFTRQGFKTAFRVVTDDVHPGGTLGRYAVKEQKGKSIAVIGVQPAVPFDFHAFDRQSRYDSPAAGSRRSRGLAVGQHDRVP